MRILQLISSLGYFGAEHVVMMLSKAFTKKRLYVYIGVVGDLNNSYEEIKKEAHKHKIPVVLFKCKGKFDIRTIFHIRNFVQRNKIDIIHSHNYKSNFYTLLSGFSSRIFKVTTCHNWVGKSFKMGLYENIDKILIRYFDKVIAVSNEIYGELIECRIPVSRLVVINNGIPLEDFTCQISLAETKKLWGIQIEDTVVGTIGRLSNEKGHIYLLQAFRLIATDFPQVKLLIVGDGQLNEYLLEEARKLNLDGRIVFTGFSANVAQMLNIMDIFVLPSLIEAMPLALLEAMAAKKTIVASSVGAIPNIIEHGKDGILVKPASVDELYNALVKVLSDKKEALNLGNNALEKAKTRFSSESMVAQYLKVYEDLIRVY